MGWRFAADAVMLVHLACITVVVAGGLAALRWPRMAWVHLPLLAYGVIIQVARFTCPLTPLENALRRRAGDAGYDGGFVEHYVVPVIYPGDFTPGVQLTLAALLIASNAVVYAFVWRRTRRRPPRRAGRASCGRRRGQRRTPVVPSTRVS